MTGAAGTDGSGLESAPASLTRFRGRLGGSTWWAVPGSGPVGHCPCGCEPGCLVTQGGAGLTCNGAGVDQTLGASLMVESCRPGFKPNDEA
jgi:hypothetical protein